MRPRWRRYVGPLASARGGLTFAECLAGVVLGLHSTVLPRLIVRLLIGSSSGKICDLQISCYGARLVLRIGARHHARMGQSGGGDWPVGSPALSATPGGRVPLAIFLLSRAWQ